MLQLQGGDDRPLRSLCAALNYLLEVPRDIDDQVVLCTDSRWALAGLRGGLAAPRSLQGTEVWTLLLAITAEDRSIYMQRVPQLRDSWE